MKRTSWLLISVLTLFCVSIVASASPDEKPSGTGGSKTAKEATQALMHEMQERVEEMLRQRNQQAQPDTSSDNWKELTDDLGLMVFRDRSGMTSGRLYVLRDEQWYPIAIEAFAELGPRIIPAASR